MLTNLKIQNYALIRDLEIEFGPGLTIVTGETGAGKSIMLGAMALMLGGRADSKTAGNGKKTVVEGIFTAPARMADFLKQNDIEAEGNELILRREISASGRSRGFINDTPVSLKILEEAGDQLIDIHSQHQNSTLTDPAAQIRIIDCFSNNEKEREAYRSAYLDFVAAEKALRTARDTAARSRQNEEFLRFQLEYLDKLKPKAGELAVLERRLEMLSSAGEISERINGARDLLLEGEDSAIDKIASARSLLEGVNWELLSDLSDDDSNLLQRFESAYLELRDAAESLEGIAEKVNADPRALEKTESRISKLYEAQARFKVTEESELLAIYADLRNQLNSLETISEDMEALSAKVKETGTTLKAAATALTESRRKGADFFAAKLAETARPLGLKNLKVGVSVTKARLSLSGGDAVEILCSFNKNQELVPLASTASGGELSRLMLSIKTLTAEYLGLPSIIFDEVDTGVSGETADRMGAMMADLGKVIQVVSITHLPQVAAKGGVHFKVGKHDEEETTVTTIVRLSEEERIHEIARMLAGAEINSAALMNARSLLGVEK